MPNFLMTIGISGSGKSFFAQHYQMYNEPHSIILDSDKLRKELLGDEQSQKQNPLIFEEMRKRAFAALRKGNSVVYCATNLSYKRRRALVQQIKKQMPQTFCMCVVMNTRVKVCKERNKQRECVVPENVIERQLASFQMPLMSEGWDEVKVWRGEEWYGFERDMVLKEIMEDVEKMKNQNNKHHKHSLSEHLTRTAKYVEDRCGSNTSDLYNAALWHDVGKPYTESKDENGESHYYNHHFVGAYYALNYFNNLHIAQLICYHMIPYFDEKEVTCWKERCGGTLWNEIMILHNADVRAH